jgi:hypothetical protein
VALNLAPLPKVFFYITLVLSLSGMGEIEKKHDLESQISKRNFFFSCIEKSHIILVKISPFRMKKFEINEPVYETFFQ